MTISRVTREGRRLHYDLQVLQQPERARACGSGPKSSADRRPVDPPPVVQMKIFEGPHRENAKDITFSYNADFFLYANLHHAPDMGSGRVAQSGTPPVLTGMPVSSMILLDRPTEAGYFIFSDLSVRHEGRYYLTFSLMEEVKEDRDKDADEHMSGTDEIVGPDTGPGQEARCWNFRTTVHTDEFDVYSAKKFPGLQESTQLSRTVAEQGCRVRIRRDVRMRRREKGKGKDASTRDDEYTRAAAVVTAAPPPPERTPTLRGRSSSNVSLERPPYPQDPHRRQSGMDFAPPRPPLAASEPSANRHLNFGGPPVTYPHPQSVPNSPSYPSLGPHYSHRSSYPYKPEPSPTHAYTPQTAPAPRDPYQRRPPPANPPAPTLAPRLDPDVEAQRSRSNMLPPISELENGVAPQRQSSFNSMLIAPMPSRTQPYQPHKDLPSPSKMEHQLAPYKLESRHSPYHKVEYASPPVPAGPYSGSPLAVLPPVSHNKRRHADAFPTADHGRPQYGRWEDEARHYNFSEASYHRASGTKVDALFAPVRD